MTNMQTLNVIIGKSLFDCAEFAAIRGLSPPFVHVYDEATATKHKKLPTTALVSFTRAFMSDPDDSIKNAVAKAIDPLANRLQLFGFKGVFYPITSITFISVAHPIMVTLAYGMTAQIQPRSVLIDIRCVIHVLEGEIVDAS